MKKIFLFLLCIIWAVNANALCEKWPVNVKITAQEGRVVYDRTHSRKDFPKLSGSPVNPNTLGLTLTPLQLSMQGKSRAKHEGERVCISLSDIEFFIGYEKITVYIDKKYPTHSCNYKVIKDHEDYHVAVAQEAMRFFRPDIERELKKAVKELRPEYAYSEARAKQITDKQFNQIQQRMKPLLDHINKKISEKQYVIDTPESYKATTKLCPKW